LIADGAYHKLLIINEQKQQQASSRQFLDTEIIEDITHKRKCSSAAQNGTAQRPLLRMKMNYDEFPVAHDRRIGVAVVYVGAYNPSTFETHRSVMFTKATPSILDDAKATNRKYWVVETLGG
jgi:hypothetical protein